MNCFAPHPLLRRLIPAVVVLGLYATALSAAELIDVSDQQRATKLVRQLGSPSFDERDRAAAELRRLGLAARPALEQGLRDVDVEIRFRSGVLLKVAVVADRNARIDRFVADVDGDDSAELPCWEDFREHYGDNRTAREVFVEMHRAEGELLEAIAAHDVAEAIRLLLTGMARFTKPTIVVKPPLAAERVPPSFSVVAAWVYAASRPEMDLDERITTQLHALLAASRFRASAAAGHRAALCHMLLDRWLLKDSSRGVRYQKLLLARDFNSDAALELGGRILHDPEATPAMLRDALVSVAHYGDPERHLPLLVAHFDNDQVCYNLRPQRDRRPSIEVRDVALAAAVRMTGQTLQLYGFYSAAWGTSGYLEHHTLGFYVASHRDSARRKWEQWSASRQVVDKHSIPRTRSRVD